MYVLIYFDLIKSKVTILAFTSKKKVQPDQVQHTSLPHEGLDDLLLSSLLLIKYKIKVLNATSSIE